MVRGRRLEPADAVVWIATTFLAMLCGLGMGFVLWSVLAATNAAWPWSASVYLLGILMPLLWPLLRGAHLRLFLGLCGLALVLSFAFGGLLFAPLLSG